MSASIAATTCPNCQQHLAAEGMLFCPNCGVNLDVWEVTAVSQTPTNYQTTANVITLHKSPLFIGRTDSNDIPLSHPAVSEQHARLEWRPEAEAWFVVDEGSAKGTYINYQKVPQGTTGQVIQPEIDTLWIAPYAFRLKTGQDQNQSSQNFEAAHLRLDARDLVRTVKHKSKDNRLQNLARRLKGQGSSAGLQILNLEPTPLSFRPGEFIALVGGSGAGKTTLMKALLGLEVAQNGTVFVSERPFIIDGQTQQFAAMHSIVGYVPQDDIVHRQLTSLEALDVIARFRLAPDLTKQERLDCIKETLEIVELWPHRDKLISQLSGGQRKRVNIALELLAEPRLLFLDEPTSGLDPGLDLVIMEILRKWATKPEDPRTIILVTHATENVTNCKYVAFLASGGYVVYFGPPQKALTYFGVDRFAEIYRQVDQYQLPELLSNSHGKANSPAPPDVVELVTRFQGSKDYFQFVQSRKLEDTAVSTPPPPPQKSTGRLFKIDPTTKQQFKRQLGILTARYWKLIRRDRINFIIMLAQGFLVAALLWAVARPDTFQPKGAENAQTVLFIMACAAVWLGILNATKEIVKEQDIYARERRYGLNAAAYVISKIIVLGAIGAFQIGTLLFIIYWQITFPDNGALGVWSPAWLEWFITLELALLAGLAVGLFLSAFASTVDSATAVMFVLLLIQVMFAGIFFSNAWADILSIFTFSRWALEGVGTTANLNGLVAASIGTASRPDAAYHFSALHLLVRWAILFGYVVLLTTAAIWRQGRKS